MSTYMDVKFDFKFPWKIVAIKKSFLIKINNNKVYGFGLLYF